MKSQCHTVRHWDVSLWFALLSPLIGVLLGFIGCVSFVEVEGANDENRPLRNKRV
jgi:hypothetical protein